MAYIGKEPIVGNFQKCDAITVVNGQAAYTLQVSSVNVSPESANHMLVSLNGILQAPTTSFTVSGSTLTFASNLATGDVIDFVMLLGNVLDLGVPSDDTVGAAQIKDDLISGTTALASEPADTDEFLVSDAGTLKRIDYSLIKGGGITEADQWRITSSANYTGVGNDLTVNWERNDTNFDKIGTGMSESSGIFTFPSTGIYYITYRCQIYMTNENQFAGIMAHVSTDSGSNFTERAAAYGGWGTSGKYTSAEGDLMLDVTNASTFRMKFRTHNQSGQQAQYIGDGNGQSTGFTFIKLGDT